MSVAYRNCFIRISWNWSENARHWPLSSALAPITIHFTQQRWIRIEKSRLGDAKLHSQSQTEPFLLSLGTYKAWLDRIHSSLLGISCGLARKMYHLSNDQKLSAKSTSLSGEFHHTEASVSSQDVKSTRHDEVLGIQHPLFVVDLFSLV